VVCNSGTSLVPTIDGTLHHFDNVGLYDALFVMQDKESKSLWNHITGEALYGPLVGHTLGPIGNLLQMNVEQALARDPDVQVAISDRSYFAGGRQFGTAPAFGGGQAPGGPAAGRGREGGRGQAGVPAGPGRGARGPGSANAALMPMFEETLGKEDDRRPRMDMGLGIFTGRTTRYYPVERIRERGEAFLDEIDGRTVLIFIDSSTSTPAALFVNAAAAELQGSEIRLDTGAVVRAGSVYDAGGARLNVERPQQIFTRWYGFALTFQGPEIFGQ
jgi:hypothetical protein